MPFEFPEDVVFNTMAERVLIALPKDEAAELLTWLNLMDTGWLTDNQYLYFVGFKDRLREQINKLPVAESSVAAVKEEKCTSHDYCIDFYNQAPITDSYDYSDYETRNHASHNTPKAHPGCELCAKKLQSFTQTEAPPNS